MQAHEAVGVARVAWGWLVTRPSPTRHVRAAACASSASAGGGNVRPQQASEAGDAPVREQAREAGDVLVLPLRARGAAGGGGVLVFDMRVTLGAPCVDDNSDISWYYCEQTQVFLL